MVSCSFSFSLSAENNETQTSQQLMRLPKISSPWCDLLHQILSLRVSGLLNGIFLSDFWFALISQHWRLWMAWNRKCPFECLDLAHCSKSYIFLLLIFSIFFAVIDVQTPMEGIGFILSAFVWFDLLY